MAEEKSESKQVNLSEGQVPPTVNKAIEFGQVPPKLNLAAEIVVGGNVPPTINLAGEIKAMVPQALLKIPLDQVAQPSPSSGGSSNAAGGDSSSGQGSGESSSGDKK